MGKLKLLIIIVAVIVCPILVCTGSSAGNFLRTAAYFSAGAYAGGYEHAPNTSENSSDDSDTSKPDPENPMGSHPTSEPDNSSSPAGTAPSEPVNVPSVKTGRIITKNRADYVDPTDYSSFKTHSGSILRYNFGKSSADCYITLDSGAQVRNCTELSNETLLAASRGLPSMEVLADSELPSVLIYHTHSTESFLPSADWYDADYPINTRASERSIVAVGDAISEALSKRGISVVHDCTIHDYPQYTGSYYRSAETILKNLEEYPSIKLVLDIHRDGIGNADGSLVAPIAEVNGKNAAQFMIISGCDGEMYNIPNFMENYKLAALLQNCSENAYPELARSLLFDYRNYNQDISTGALLIEVGSQGNSLEEVVYTGELLGNVIADAIEKMSQ